MAISSLPYLLGLFNNSVWFLKGEDLENIATIFKHKLNTGTIKEYLALHDPEEDEKKKRAQVKMVGNTAILPIIGNMVPEATTMQALCGFTSTFDLTTRLLELDADSKVENIVLHFQSGGGEVTGGFEFADAIFNSKKRVIAFSDTVMGSLAFLAGSAASEIILAPSAVVGSIGARITVMKVKPETQEADFFTFQSGDKKAFGDPNIPMSPEEMTFFQDKITQLFDRFVSAVSTFRNVSEQSIRDTEAGSEQAMLIPSSTRSIFFDRIMPRDTFMKEVLNGTI